MQLILDNSEKKEYFYNALCNGLSSLQHDFDIELSFEDADYVEARDYFEYFTGNSPCFEDVLMSILFDRNKTLTFIDHNEFNNNVHVITKDTVLERVNNTPMKHLIDMFNGHDDATTATVILQQVIFNEQIYA
jgi:hypothetical protein